MVKNGLFPILFANGDMRVKGMKIRLCTKDLTYSNNVTLNISNHTCILLILPMHTTHTTT
jgi:hypothetical protein